MDKYFYNEGHVEINFFHKEESYIIRGRTRIRGNILHIDFGYFGDEVACIMLEYNYVKEKFYIGKIQPKKLGSSSKKDRGICLQPALKEKGSLDLLVLFSIKIAEILNPQAQVFLYDLATINDGKPLSWLKFFSKRETTYSKYGFIRKEKTLKKDDSKSYEAFKVYMENLSEYLEEEDIDDLEEDTIKDLKRIFNLVNKNRKKEGLTPIEFSKSYTLEKTIKNLIKTELWEEAINLINRDTVMEIGLNTNWYLSWYYYKHNISSNDKVKIAKISNI
jgi:hypothetical protein